MMWLFFVFLLPLDAFAAAVCPGGMVAVEYDNYVASTGGVCPSGYVVHDMVDVCGGTSTGVCWLRPLCGAGVTQIKTSSGVVVSLYSDRVTVPSFCAQYNNMVCYADMVLGQVSGAINVDYADAIYHLE